MFKFIEKIKNKANKALISAKVAAETALTSKKGEGYISTAVKWIIGIVIGGVILVALYALFKDNILTKVSTKLTEYFNYSGPNA